MARSSRTSQASQARAARQIKRLYEMCAMAIVAGRADLDGAAEVGFDIELPVFSVGAAGELANVHPQTLRQYDRLGLVVPQRTEGGARRYSLRDISRLAQAQQLSQEEGVNLAGITRILELEEENRELRRQVERLGGISRRIRGTKFPASAEAGRFQRVRRGRGRWHRGSRAVPARAHVAQAAASRCTAASVARIRTGGTCGRGGRYGLQVSGSLGNSLTAHSLTFLKSAGKP